MKPFLILIGACAGMVAIGWIVSKVTGSKAWFIDDWKYEEGETVLWRDQAADFFTIEKYGQAVYMSFPRMHRYTVVVTNRRILVAVTAAFTKKRMVQYVLYPKTSPDGQTEHIGGGQLTVGYQSLVIQPEMAAHLDEKKPYVELTPSSEHASSMNLSRLRIYSDQLASFRLP